MPYRIAVALEIESGHALAKHPGPCRIPHGHSRRVEIVLEADALDSNDMVCDFIALRDRLETAARRYDHAMCLNTDDPHYATLRHTCGERVVGFDHEDPTTEVMARRIHDDCAADLPAGVRIVRVRVSETSTCWAEYLPALTDVPSRETTLGKSA